VSIIQPVDTARETRRLKKIKSLIIYCTWSAGPIVEDDACTWEGMKCQGGDILRPDVKDKDVHIDFTLAIQEAAATRGCCYVDNSCHSTPQGTPGCMMRGTATWHNPQQGEYMKVYIEIDCDLRAFTCTMVDGVLDILSK